MGLPSILRYLLDLVLPPRCPGCRAMVADDGRFCVACWQELRFITAPMCARCGTPFEHDMGPAAECGACLAEPPRYAAARAALVYGGPARKLLLALKHGDRQHLVSVMAPHMARAAAPWLDGDALLVPVPLHRGRLWRRGFNQSALLARALARISGAPLAIDALERVKPTPASRGMGRKARIANVRGAFRVPDRNRVAGRRIVLVDDVMTSGATADACARLLRRAGARDVHVLTFARAVREAEPIRQAAAADPE
ncbi:ComF family protein [Sandarakinorhabdus sp. DWP1-3-1]|uniref:ComF family protein n=1 Tax=Sandarakinorhabdus sp. DWP1-3-1 TaxID=2804627 RepID=UPI003CF3BD59